MTYIVVSENEIVKAEMAVPDCWGWSGPTPMECKKCIKFQAHCLSLPRIPIEGKHKWEVWQEVVEGKDFVRGYQVYVSVDNWMDCEYLYYRVAEEDYRRIVAIPIQPTPEGEKPKCNGNCGMSYCDEYGCIENKPKGDVSHLLTPLEELKLDSNTIRLIERLKELQPYHINPYNLGDEGEVSAIIDKLANLLTNNNPQTK